MTQRHGAPRLAALSLVALACGACPQPGTKTAPPPAATTPALTKGPQPSALVISAPAIGGALILDASSGLSLPMGLTKQLIATEQFADGTTRDVTATASWTSSSSAAGTISSSGLVSGAAVGNTTITASLGGLTQTFPLAVGAGIASIRIATDLSGLWVGAAQPVLLVATLTDRSELDVTAQATWSSSASGVVTVSSSGLARGVAVGSATVTANVATFTTSAMANVLATQPVVTSIALGTTATAPTSSTLALLPGLPRALAVWGTYSETNAVQDITANAQWTWVSSNPASATVSPSGVLAGVAAGTTTVTVTGLGGLTASLTVTVTAAIQSIALAGLPASLGPGTYTFPEVLGTLADSSVVDVTGFTTFTSSSRHILSVQGTALVARTTLGPATITATVGAATAAATVNVNAVTALQIVPNTLSIPAGFVDNAVAVFATLSDGSVIETTATATWTTSAPAVAAVGMANVNQANAPVSGQTPGSATLTAKLGGTTATAQVTVTPAVTVTSLAVMPPSGSFYFDAPRAITVMATLSDTTTLDVTRFVSWTVSSAGGGLARTTDFTPGIYAARSPAGISTVSAHLGSVQASAMVTVSDATLTSLAISPPTSSLTAGMTQALTVTATYSDLSTADVTARAILSSSDSTGAVVVVNETPTSRTTVVAEGTGMATLTAWVAPAGAYMTGATELSATAAVTVQ